MREQYMRTGEGFIICYSVTDRRSFDEAVAYKHLIDRVRNQEDIPVVLVGNKCDLESERKVSHDWHLVVYAMRMLLNTSNIITSKIFRLEIRMYRLFH